MMREDALLRGVDEGLAEALARARAALVAQAERERTAELFYRRVPSPLGELLLVAGHEGVLRLAFEGEDHEAVLAELAARVSPRLLEGGSLLAEAARELQEYFAGRRRDFEVPVDLRLARGFRARVAQALRGIRYGERRSYAEVARLVGSPQAVRAVGTACARNPVPLLVPCHRVVRSDGTVGAYRGGHEAKRFLLSLEAAA